MSVISRVSEYLSWVQKLLNPSYLFHFLRILLDFCKIARAAGLLAWKKRGLAKKKLSKDFYSSWKIQLTELDGRVPFLIIQRAERLPTSDFPKLVEPRVFCLVQRSPKQLTCKLWCGPTHLSRKSNWGPGAQWDWKRPGKAHSRLEAVTPGPALLLNGVGVLPGLDPTLLLTSTDPLIPYKLHSDVTTSPQQFSLRSLHSQVNGFTNIFLECCYIQIY